MKRVGRIILKICLFFVSIVTAFILLYAVLDIIETPLGVNEHKQMIQKERLKLGIPANVTITVLIRNGGGTYVQPISFEKFVVVLETRSALSTRHELYHIHRVLLRKVLSIGKMDYALREEPLACIYEVIGLDLGAKQ